MHLRGQLVLAGISDARVDTGTAAPLCGPTRGPMSQGGTLLIRRIAAIVAASAFVVVGLAAGSAEARASWVANSPSQIEGSNKVRLVGGNTSVETADLDMPVQAGDVVSFQYKLAGGAECTAGAPRVFVTVGGVVTNSWDQNIAGGSQCGSNGVVTFTVPAAGRVGAAGVVYDNGKPGEVTVTNLTVGGARVNFTAAPILRVTPQAPVVVQPTCEARRGSITAPEVEGVQYMLWEDNVGRFMTPDRAYRLPAGEYRVTAAAKDGYRLTVGAKRTWEVELVRASSCPSPSPSPTVTPTPEAVTPVAPTLEQRSCENSGVATLTIPAVEGVVYKAGNGDVLEAKTYTVQPGEAKVTAEAAEGHVLAEDAVSEWNFTVDEGPTACPGPQGPQGEDGEDGTDGRTIVVNQVRVPTRIDTGLGGMAA